ncbi:TPA: hypothetical protein DDW35_11665 [Candidatus Sumerlaeota bacterium]|jgi:spore germination protein GerM|nr:hypothetical protein [Candidatus Sumerlaeota bacterium]
MNRRGSTTFTLVLFVASAAIFVGIMLLLGWWIMPPSSRQENTASTVLLAEPATSLGAQAKKPQQTKSANPVQKNKVRIYFTPDGIKLQAQEMDPPTMEPYRRLHWVLDELLRGPQGGSLQSPLPKNVKLRAAYLMQNTAVVDLSDEMYSERLGGTMTECLCIAAIVNTVVDNVDGVRNVRLMINGQAAQTLWGDVDISTPLASDPSLVVE